MAQAEKLLVFLASPGDVPNERRYVQEVVEDLNRTVASQKGIVLQVVTWEKNAFPGYGMDAQALINAQIAEMEKYSLFVGIMWNRFGTPTPRSESGTVEEFERAVAALAQHGHPDIWFYFRQAPAKLDTEEQLDQRKKVLEFRKRVQAKGMPWSYKSPADFRNELRNQMILWVNSLNREAAATQSGGADNKSPSFGAATNPVDVATGRGLPRMGHGGEISMMNTGALIEAAIGRDAYLAAEAAIEIQKRGPDETKRIFDGDWQKAPAPRYATTENFLRDVFHAFGQNFAHHLVDVLEKGTRNAVDVAAYAFPRASILPQVAGDLYAWASRQVNGRLRDWDTMVLPMIAVGSAGLAAYAWDVIKRADDKRKGICGETLVRLFVQADSRNDADHVLEGMRKLIQNAHDEHWPNPQFLLARLPAWPLTSAAVDSLVERGLAVDQLPEIQQFASEALICAGARRVVSELVQRSQRNQINRADAIRLIALLGGPQAAQFVITAPGTPRDQALVLPWLVPTLDASAMDAVLRDEENRFLVSRALGLAKTKADWIESVLSSTNWLNRGYAGLGLAYARGSEAKRALLDALDAVHGEGSEAVHERILLNAALVVTGAHEHAQEILRWLPAHSMLREDLAKQDVLAALSMALGRDHLAVRAWRRVGCAPARLDPEVSQHATL